MKQRDAIKLGEETLDSAIVSALQGNPSYAARATARLAAKSVFLLKPTI